MQVAGKLAAFAAFLLGGVFVIAADAAATGLAEIFTSKVHEDRAQRFCSLIFDCDSFSIRCGYFTKQNSGSHSGHRTKASIDGANEAPL